MLVRMLAASRLAQATMLLGGLLAGLVALQFMANPAPMSEGDEAGTVISIDTAQPEGRETTTTVATAVVELPDGRRTGQFLSQPWPRTGDTVRLRYTALEDGTRTYVHDPLL